MITENTSPVRAELPAGFVQIKSSGGARICYGILPGGIAWDFFHHCPHCGGWVEGLPIRHNFKRIPSLRSGLGNHCARCDADLLKDGES